MGRGPGPTTNIAKFAVTDTGTAPGYTTDLLQGNGVHVSNNGNVPTNDDGHYGYGMLDLLGGNFSLNTQVGPVGVTYPYEYIQQPQQADWPSNTQSTSSFGFTTTGVATDITHQDASNNLQTIAWGLKGSDAYLGVPNPNGCTGGIKTSKNGGPNIALQLGDLVGANGPSADSDLLGVALSRDGLFTAVSYRDDRTTNATSLAILDPTGNIVNTNKLGLDFSSDYNQLGNLIAMSGADADGKYYIAVAQGGAAGPGFNAGFDFIAIYQFDPSNGQLAYVNTSQNENTGTIQNNTSLGVSAPGDIKILRISDDGNWVMTCAPGSGVVQLYKNPKTLLPNPNEGLQCVTVPTPTVAGFTGFGEVGDLATAAPDVIGDDGIVAVAAFDNGGDPAQVPAGTIYLYRFNLRSGEITSTTPIELQSTDPNGDGYIPGLNAVFFTVGALKSLRFNTVTSPDANILTITTDNADLTGFQFDIVATWLITYA